MVDWRIYYDDGSTFDSTQGGPNDAPALGILVINQNDKEAGPHQLAGFDYYWHENGWWYGGDLFGFWDYLQRVSLVKFGRAVYTKVYHAIRREAELDADFKGDGVAATSWKRE